MSCLLRMVSLKIFVPVPEFENNIEFILDNHLACSEKCSFEMLQTEKDFSRWNKWCGGCSILQIHFQSSVSYKALGLGAGGLPQSEVGQA